MKRSFSHKTAINILGCLLGYGWLVPAYADAIDWANLNANEQAVLKPFAATWAQLPEAKQVLLRKWAAKTPEQRALIKQRYQQWQALNPQQQAIIHQKMLHYQQLSPNTKAKLQLWHQWFKRLPTVEQQKLKQTWPSLDSTARKTYIQQLQAQYP